MGGRQPSLGPGKQWATRGCFVAQPAPVRRCRPDAVSLLFFSHYCHQQLALGRGPCARPGSSPVVAPALASESILTALSGGSLGSCVDEERSQLRELM